MGKFKTFLEETKVEHKLKFKFRHVAGGFYCSGNELTSLEGCPKEVGGSFYCNSNQLTSLEGAPKEVGGDFECVENPGPYGKGFTKEDVKKVCDVKGDIYIKV